MKKTLFILATFFVLMAGAQSKHQYNNPILSGFYPDPSICRAGEDYYLVTSSFAYYPGLPVFHSKDLVSWEQLGHAMDRPSQLNLDGAGVSRGLFAPAISYYDGLFYIVCTLIDRGGNFVITAKDPAGPWSDPVWLDKVDGIDPSLFFEKNGKAWLVYNSVAPDNKPLWNGHRTIRMRSFDPAALRAGSEEILLVDGGSNISQKPVWIEGPHLYFINGWYYLMCAEGGTGYNHSEVVFRSRQVEGPFQPYENNPILTQRQLDPNRKNPVTTTGHADLVQTTAGQWYAVFLGCRPYEGNHFNTGRETFLTPVTWKNEWPIINDGNELVLYHYPLPKLSKNANNAFSGNVFFNDDFGEKKLDPRWIFLRTLKENWYSLEKGKGIGLQLRPETLAGKGNPSFLAHRQQNLEFTATIALRFQPAAPNEKAGLTIFQNEDHFYYVCISQEEGKRVVQLFQSLLIPADTSQMKLLASTALPAGKTELVYLQVTGSKNIYSFQFSTDRKNWQTVGNPVDAKFLSTETAGGFVGCTIGLYASSLGKPSESVADFLWFEYKGNDEVYK